MSNKNFEKMRDVFELANHTTNLHMRYDGLEELNARVSLSTERRFNGMGEYVDSSRLYLLILLELSIGLCERY